MVATDITSAIKSCSISGITYDVSKKKFKLHKDLVLTEDNYISLDESETFDGRHHQITILDSSVGLICNVTSLLTMSISKENIPIVKNLKVVNNLIASKSGGIIRNSDVNTKYIKVINCEHIGDVNPANNVNDLGGIMGYVSIPFSHIIIKNCKSKGSKIGNFSGGIVGTIRSGLGHNSIVKIKRCCSEFNQIGNTSATGNNGFSGGICGEIYWDDGQDSQESDVDVSSCKLRISRCHSKGTITCNSAGIFCGVNISYGAGTTNMNSGANIKISDCYSTGDIDPTIMTSTEGYNAYYGGAGIMNGFYGNAGEGPSGNTLKIKNCYSSGTIGNNSSGILNFNNSNNNRIIIENCYSLGDINGTGTYNHSTNINPEGESSGIFNNTNTNGTHLVTHNNNSNTSIYNCYSLGNQLNDDSFGICGHVQAPVTGILDTYDIDSCYTSGLQLTPYDDVVPAPTNYFDLHMTNCYSDGDYTTNPYIILKYKKLKHHVDNLDKDNYVINHKVKYPLLKSFTKRQWKHYRKHSSSPHF